MPRQIIILEQSTGPGGDQNISFAFWLNVSAGRQVPQTTIQSAFRAATATEINALQAGTVVETVDSTQYPPAFSTAQIQADLQIRYAAAQASLNANVNPNTFYGASWDGASWTAAPVVPPPGRTSNYLVGAAQFNTIGDNTAIAATANQAISVWRLLIVANGTVAVTIKNGAAAMLGPYNMVSGSQLNLLFNQEPWFVTTPGSALVIGLSAAIVVATRAWFTKG